MSDEEEKEDMYGKLSVVWRVERIKRIFRKSSVTVVDMVEL